MSTLDHFNLKEKVILVTGGAGQYGAGLVRAYAETGARVIAASRGREALDRMAAELTAAGLSVTALVFDQSSEASIMALRDEIHQRFGRLDCLVNNAVARPMQGHDDSIENFARSMEINATGLFLITRILGQMFVDQGQGGSIINVGSIQGAVGPDPALYQGLGMSGFYPDYFFHKGGMVNFTRYAASYYGRSGIRCNCVLPGGVLSSKLPEEFVRRYCERTMLGRMASPDDLAGIMIFLASDASSYITGAIIPVDGGYTAK